MKLTTNWDTYAKLKPVDSNRLSDSKKKFIPAKTKLNINWSQPSENNHVQVSMETPLNGVHNWHFYDGQGCITVEGNEKNNSPKDKIESYDRGKLIELPGFQGSYGLSRPIITNGNFTWGEATHGGTRIPVGSDVVYGIIKIAKAMEEVRAKCGDRSIKVNSWYRDPVTNRNVGGASRSRHLSGDAIDFVVQGISPYDVYKILNEWWGRRGGLASSSVFTHIDARGYRARWSYGF